MGMIAAVTPGTRQRASVPRRKVTAKDISEAGKVEIHYFDERQLQEVEIKYNKVKITRVVDPTSQLDIIWKTSLLFGINRPSWPGMMQHVLKGHHQGKSYNIMSFTGSIGHLMAGSGLREIIEIIYAPNAVDHVLSGKAISRAVRAHLIVDAVLNCLLFASALGVPIPILQEPARPKALIEEVRMLFQKLRSHR
ncbi:uncharacterized protein LOC114574747 [Exaiptasia diaphana]|uniref:Uncharacterized protein n=1 Tax=Exaiptasia diaphana TaxID=2652724 RepID=A0A913YG18_EXADI|nr:uncharacterized protein LOC114574747 [Exaiptasia diaphana]